MLMSIAAYCLVLGVIAASAVVASKGKSEARKRNISANAQVQHFFILFFAIFKQEPLSYGLPSVCIPASWIDTLLMWLMPSPALLLLLSRSLPFCAVLNTQV